MGNMTLAIPDELQKEMKGFPEIKWSEVARKALKEKVEILKLAEKISKKSKLTKTDVQKFSKKINKLAAQRFLDENNN